MRLSTDAKRRHLRCFIRSRRSLLPKTADFKLKVQFLFLHHHYFKLFVNDLQIHIFYTDCRKIRNLHDWCSISVNESIKTYLFLAINIKLQLCYPVLWQCFCSQGLMFPFYCWSIRYGIFTCAKPCCYLNSKETLQRVHDGGWRAIFIYS